MSELGRALILVGGALALLGLLVVLAGRVPWLGRLPGDIVVRRDDFTLHVPIVTCALVSVILTALFSLLRR